jgi:hypothetical protein
MDKNKIYVMGAGHLTPEEVRVKFANLPEGEIVIVNSPGDIPRNELSQGPDVTQEINVLYQLPKRLEYMPYIDDVPNHRYKKGSKDTRVKALNFRKLRLKNRKK